MKILFLPNWKVKHYDSVPENIQPSNYVVDNQKFWFFKYFLTDVSVDVLSIPLSGVKNKIEKIIHFHLFQTFKAIKTLRKARYDIIFVHGTDSAIFLCFLKRLLRIKTPPIIVVDISSFYHGTTNGIIFKFCQYSSKKIDFLFYHCSSQKDYFNKYFPWLTDKSAFVKFGVDVDYWISKKLHRPNKLSNYIVCAGYRMRDWNTLINAFEEINTNVKLHLIGAPNFNINFNKNKVKVYPILPIDELNEQIINAKFSIIPLVNLNYSFGQMTLLQQMALGIPILTSDSNSIKDYINESDVIVYKSGSIENLKHNLELLLNLDDDSLKLLGVKNQNFAKKENNEVDMAHFFEKVILELLGKKLHEED